MKFISWNVNGIRACVQKGFMDVFNELDADIFCIQESKMQAGQLELDMPGYHCTLLFLSLVGTMGMMQSQPIDITGMYGTILLHEDAGGYVLVAVISFTVAVVITALCIKFRKKGQKSQDAENHV